MITFNPVTATAPIQLTTENLISVGGSPAAVVRVQGTNLNIATASGVANLETGELATAGQRYEIGSQTKMMTSVIVLQLAAEGKINLDAPLSDYLGAKTLDGISNAELATVRQLLQMTSGIANYTEVRGEDGVPLFVAALLANPDQAFGADDSLNLVRGLPATGNPGEFSYSNTNYLLLGKLIEAQTNQSLAQTFEQRIFNPAGMTNSDLEGAMASGDGLQGYLEGPDGIINTTFAMWDKGAEGGVVSTTQDMIKFFKALFVDQTILPPSQLAEMKSLLLTGGSDAFKAYFGLGLSIVDIEGAGRFYGFTGQTLGHLSTTYISETTGTIITLDVNYADSTANTDLIAIELLTQLARDPAWDSITAFDPSSETLQIEAVNAASLIVDTGAVLSLTFGSATFTLPTALNSVTSTNLTFSDGSVLVVGDNTTSIVRDSASNHIDILRDFATAANQDNQVLGLGGDDRIRGGNGADKLLGGDGNDQIWGRAGNDRIFGERGSDFLSGGNGSDYLNGGAGNDVLKGGRGQDILTGGYGSDVFDFDQISESGRSDTTRDIITDFVRGYDKIDLSTIDANHCRAGDQDFNFIGSSDFSGRAGQLHYVWVDLEGASDDRTIIEGDVNGDRVADFQIELNGLQHLSCGDFVF